MQFAYDVANRRTSQTLPNGVVTNYGYDSASELSGLAYSLGENALGNLVYSYDLAGRRVATGGSLARTSLPVPITLTAYDANNQLTQWGTATPTYDSNGNALTDGTNTYIWDARNHLVSMNMSAESFQYDAFGRRVAKTILGTTTKYLFDGGNPVQEISGTSPTANLLTGGIDEYFQRTDSNGQANFLVDGLGSTLALTDTSGNSLAQYTYEPFGSTVSSGGSANSYQYTGRENDQAGLNFYRARYYSPGFQRFISEDPRGFGGGQTNIYAYVGNDPTDRSDPTGLFAPTWHISITYTAAVLNGYDQQAALDLALRTAGVDARGCTYVLFGGPDCSQNPDAGHANTHAMAGRKNGKPQKCQQAYQGAQQQLVNDLGCGDIAKALHTIEDSFAAGHRNFQFWPGGIPSWAHRAGDWFPSSQSVTDATVAAGQFLGDMDMNLNLLNSGNPIDVTKYFPPNPCPQ